MKVAFQLGAANNGQNFPVLADVYSGVTTRIRGTLDGAPGKTYQLQFFASPTGDSSGYGEGQVFLGQMGFALGTSCSSNFTAYLPALVPPNWAVTATAADSSGNTSEFSAWVPVVLFPALAISFANPGQHQISLSWTNNGGSFSLQQTFSLSPPVQWNAVTNTVVLTNGFFAVALPSTPTNTFYRLLAP